MPLAPGSKLGSYQVLALLGAGGMGEVYRARDPRLVRDVAIKVLPESPSSEPSRKQRLEREDKSISKLSHPHVCALYDIGYQDGAAFLVMELVSAFDLFSYDVSNDGERFLIATKVAETSAAPLSIVLNWTSAMEK